MPGGRPSKIDQVARVTDSGQQITVADQVVERIRLGLDLTVAADSAGISRASLHKWQVRGARARATAAQSGRAVPRPEQPYVAFVDALERAQGEAEANRLAIINRAATGGAVITKTTRKVQLVHNPDGSVTEREVERTEVTETLRPEWTAAAWWLERKRGYIKRYELTGAQGAPLVPQAEAARDLADSLRDWLSTDADASAAAAEQVQATRRKAPAGG